MSKNIYNIPAIFDRKLHAEFISKSLKHFGNSSFLFDRVSENTLDLLNSLDRYFRDCLVYGFFKNHSFIKAENLFTGHIVENALEFIGSTTKNFILYDEENINLGEKRFDLIISNLSLHFINDLPGALIRYLYALKPEGLFIANLFGDFTLYELKDVLALADMKCRSGVSPRVSPMVSSSAASELMQRACFVNPVVQSERITVKYKNMEDLLKDLKYTGQANCMQSRSRAVPPKTFFKIASEFYRSQYQIENLLPATFDIITLIGSKSS